MNNLCDTCKNYGCPLQSGIIREKCDFYFDDKTSTIERLSKAMKIVTNCNYDTWLREQLSQQYCDTKTMMLESQKNDK